MRPHHILDHLGDGAKHLLDTTAAFVALGARPFSLGLGFLPVLQIT